MALLFIGSSVSSLRFAPPHVHDVWEIILNLEGSGVTIAAGEEYRFFPGNILCIPPNTEHTKISDEGFTDIFISCNNFPLAMEAKNQPLVFEDDSAENFRSLMHLMLNIYHKKENNYLVVVNSLYEAAAQFLVGKKETHTIDENIEQIKDMLISSFTDPEVNIDRILSQSRYSQDHIRRLFKQAEGVTPSEYLTSLRIDCAKKLLEQNGLLHLSVNEIGLMSGYYDIHYFSRIFRSKTGMSPRDYMRACKS